jgi:NAD(P)-dependent dehydrogenase (short-subunit alcohol dehydrogenase family)
MRECPNCQYCVNPFAEDVAVLRHRFRFEEGVVTIAVVTGGGGSAGRAIGAAFIARGLDVAVLDIDAAAAEASAHWLATLGGGAARAWQCDLTDEAMIASVWREIEATQGAIGAVANNAGIFERTNLAAMTKQVWSRTIDANLTSAFLVSRQAVLAWQAKSVGGSIVNISSNAGLVAGSGGGVGGALAYAASKAGIIALTHHFAVDYGPAGIRTNAVAPGVFESRLNADRLADPADRARATSIIPLGRVGRPEDVAACVVFLALDAEYVNGEVLVCDGGTYVAALRAGAPVNTA